MNRNSVADSGHSADGHESNSEDVFLDKWHLFMGMMRMNSGGGQGIYCRGGGMHGRRKSGTERADAGYISQTDVPKNERIHAHFFYCIRI